MQTCKSVSMQSLRGKWAWKRAMHRASSPPWRTVATTANSACAHSARCAHRLVCGIHLHAPKFQVSLDARQLAMRSASRTGARGLCGDVTADATKKRSGSNAKGGSASTSTSSLEELRSVRLQKADELRTLGVPSDGQGSGSTNWMPFAYRFERTHLAKTLHDLYVDLEPGADVDEATCDPFAVCGRVMAKRVFGKLAFVTVEDVSGPIQLQISKANLPSTTADGTLSGTHAVHDGQVSLSFAEMKKLVDLGDIVGARGGLRRTEKGELSVNVNHLVVLTKAVRPLPDKWHGLGEDNLEARYRQREVDLIVSGAAGLARKALVARAATSGAIRRYLDDLGFMEVETPVLHARAGGADARPFATRHNALGKHLTLRIATELHLKRLVVGGMERVYEIGRIFRNEGISTRHNPEFTSVEVYQAYADYHDMMALTEDLVKTIARSVLGNLNHGHGGGDSAGDISSIEYQGETLDLQAPFQKHSMSDIVRTRTGVDPFEVQARAEAGGEPFASLLLSALREKGLVDLNEASSLEIETACLSSAGHALGCLFELFIEKELIQPTFITDLPLAISPLAKPHREFPTQLAERFELFVCGRELANAFSELTDPVDQRMRFEQQMESHRVQRQAALSANSDSGVPDDLDYDIEVDEEFLSALEHGLPPTAGMGLGIDRLLMMLVNAPSIRDVISFPLLR